MKTPKSDEVHWLVRIDNGIMQHLIVLRDIYNIIFTFTKNKISNINNNEVTK